MKNIIQEKIYNFLSDPFIKNLLISTVKTITDITNADKGLFFLYNHSTDKFELFFTIDKNDVYNSYSSKFEDKTLKIILDSEPSIDIISENSNQEHLNKISSFFNKKYHSAILSGLKSDEYKFGLIEILKSEPSSKFSETELQTVKKLINLTISTIKGIIFQEIQKYNKFDKFGLKLGRRKSDIFVIGKSPAILEIMKNVEKIAKTSSTILLMGESGTGKEVLAKMIHLNSDRADNQFVKINCAAIPENLLESELFGHEKGAFTGAIAKKTGKLEIADKGTVFFDEIGEMPLNLQVKLLNFLQEKEFERIGSTKTIKVDVRIVTATNKNLEKSIEENKFREDLYYRLNVFPIYLPPLRERKEDIPIFIEYFINKHNEDLGKNFEGITDEALFLLKKYSWPGNIRELGNIIERAMIICTKNVITPNDLPQEIFGIFGKVRQKDKEFRFREGSSSLWEVEKGIIERILRETNYNQSLTAKKLGITRNHLRYRLKKWNISVKNKGKSIEF